MDQLPLGLVGHVRNWALQLGRQATREGGWTWSLDLWTGSWAVASWLRIFEAAPGKETDLRILSTAEYLCQTATQL